MEMFGCSGMICTYWSGSISLDMESQLYALSFIPVWDNYLMQKLFLLYPNSKARSDKCL